MNYDSITIHKGLTGIQKRPGMYIGDVSNGEAVHNMIWEVLYNSIDEHCAGHTSNIFLYVRDDQVLVTDRGRGIPNEWHSEEGRSNLEIVHTYFHAGGKFDDSNYQYSSGLHGIGLTVVNALSRYLLVVSQRERLVRLCVFIDGVCMVDRTWVSTRISQTGTWTLFSPNPVYLEETQIDESIVREKVLQCAYIYKDLNILLSTNERHHSRYHGQGIIRLFKHLTKGYVPIVESSFDLDYVGDTGQIHTIFNWYTGGGTYANCYCNGLKQSAGGTHLNALIKAIRDEFLNYSEGDLSLNTLKEGLHLVIDLKLKDPQYSSQTKERLTSKDASLVVRECFRKFKEYFLLRGKEIRTLIRHLLSLEKRKQEVLQERVINTGEGILSGGLPSKLMPCKSNDISVNELFIVEGGSAGATTKAARDSMTQAILPIRGKILNVERTSLSRAIKSESVRDLIACLGTGVGSTFNMDKLRYGKIFFMSDADCDGFQISGLCVSVVYKYLRPLIPAGRIYIARPPLFRLRIGKREIFFITRSSLEHYLLKLKGLSIMAWSGYRSVIRFYMYDNVKLEMLSDLYLTSSNKPSYSVNTPRGDSFYQVGFKAHLNMIRIPRELKLTIAYLAYMTGQSLPIKYLERVLDFTKYKIYRFKGLGQMNWEELWSHVMNPDTRSVYRLTLRDAQRTHRLYQNMMGSDPKWRKLMIANSGLSFYDLDI